MQGNGNANVGENDKGNRNILRWRATREIRNAEFWASDMAQRELTVCAHSYGPICISELRLKPI